MTHPARIPADVHRPDRILGPFTARQTILLASTATLLYLGWVTLRAVAPWPVLLAAAVPLAALAAIVIVGHRDGLPLDRLLIAALRHQLNPRCPPHGNPAHPIAGRQRAAGQRPAPHGLLSQAAITSLDHDPAGPGVLALGADGLVAIAAVSTLNLRLRTPTEQDALLAGFARYLHTLTGPTQFLIRTLPVDLTGHLTALHEQARMLPHPALVTAALAHHAHLARLAAPAPTDPEHRLQSIGDGSLQAWPGDGGGQAEEPTLLSRQLLLVLRAPAGRGGAQQLRRRLDDAATILAALDITVTPLPATHIRALLGDCCNPDHLPGGRRLVTAAAPVPIVRRHPTHDLDDYIHPDSGRDTGGVGTIGGVGTEWPSGAAAATDPPQPERGPTAGFWGHPGATAPPSMLRPGAPAYFTDDRVQDIPGELDDVDDVDGGLAGGFWGGEDDALRWWAR